jgi:hypothetical protein
MQLKRIRLELSRSSGSPQGNPNFGYEFIAPLDGEGRLDTAAWPEAAQLCTFRHFQPGLEDVQGELIHRGGGAWAFSYKLGDSDDELIYRLGQHRLRPGEYVSIAGQDGVSRTYRVAAVEELHIHPKRARPQAASPS